MTSLPGSAIAVVTWALLLSGSNGLVSVTTAREPAVQTATTDAAVSRRPMNVRKLFPPAGARGACPDTPLRLTFAGPPEIGASGRIQLFDAADHRLVESIEISSRMAVKSIGGLDGFKYFPVIVSGNEVSIYPKNGVLARNRSYFVTIDSGVFRNGADNFAGINERAGWRFTTRAAAPSGNAARLTVAADGTGDFCTVQGALDFIPDGNRTPITIFVRKGTYTEIVFFSGKHRITLLGEDRKQSVITYANNAAFNNGGGNPFGVSAPNPGAEPLAGGSIYRRGVFLAQRVSDLVITNLTFRNTTPQGGSQAEAIILNGTTAARAILKDIDLYSYQDTLQINGQAFVSNCYIEGDVDFMWGTGPCFFENCVCRSLRSGAYYTQVRNPGTNHGYVYLRCVFDGIPGVVGNYLSRIQPARFPNSEVVLLDCILGNAVGPVAWQFQDSPGVPIAGSPDVRFWEFNSRGADGKSVDVSRRLAASRQLNLAADSAIIASYGSPAFVLGNGWNPKLAPVFIVRPGKRAGKTAGG